MKPGKKRERERQRDDRRGKRQGSVNQNTKSARDFKNRMYQTIFRFTEYMNHFDVIMDTATFFDSRIKLTPHIEKWENFSQ